MFFQCFAVTYFANNKAGITVFGFMLDRTCLHTIFAVQLSLTLWLLNKTIFASGFWDYCLSIQIFCLFLLYSNDKNVEMEKVIRCLFNECHCWTISMPPLGIWLTFNLCIIPPILHMFDSQLIVNRKLLGPLKICRSGIQLPSVLIFSLYVLYAT